MGAGASASPQPRQMPPSVAAALSSASSATRAALDALPGDVQTELLEVARKLAAEKERPLRDTTAKAVAKSRLLESLMPPEKRLFVDPFASAFLEGAEAGIVAAGVENVLGAFGATAPGLHETLVLRTRWLDDLVLDAVGEERGCRQLLLIAAGYDARAFRLPLPESVRTFEVRVCL